MTLITEYELAGFSFEEGEEQRKAGERLAASYVNFYITNGGVLIPQFEDEMDAEAVNIIGGAFSRKEGIPGLRTRYYCRWWEHSLYYTADTG